MFKFLFPTQYDGIASDEQDVSRTSRRAVDLIWHLLQHKDYSNAWVLLVILITFSTLFMIFLIRDFDKLEH